MREHQIQPPCRMMNHFQQLLQVLPQGFEQKATRCHAFQRARKVKSPLELFKLIMLYCGFDFSLRSCAGTFAQTYGSISDEAVKKRLTACIHWIKETLNDLLCLQHTHPHGDLKFIVVDGSTVQEPGATQISYRLHLAMDLMSLSWTDAVLTTDKIGENLQHYQLREGYVLIADRGYNCAKTIMPIVDQGADVIVRYSPNSMPVYTFDESNKKTKIDWQQQLSRNPDQKQVIEGYMVLGNQRIKGYVHAYPRTAHHAKEERRIMLKKANQGGSKPRSQTLYLTGWMLIFSTIPPNIITTEEIQNLYKARWQIELAIKRLKSILNIDLLRAKKGSQLAQVYLLGKLLYATLLEKINSKIYVNYGVGEFDSTRTLSPWRILHRLHEQVKSSLLFEYPVNPNFIEDSIKSMSERPRKRRLQTLPDNIYTLIQSNKSA